MNDEAITTVHLACLAQAALGCVFWVGSAGIWLPISAHAYATYLVRLEIGDIDDISLICKEPTR